MVHTSGNIDHSPWSEMHALEHVVQFAETDASLLNAVSAFIEAGLRAGDPCVVIATQQHRESLELRLRADGHDMDSVQMQDQYLALDANAMLELFLVDEEPDIIQFATVIEPLIGKVAKGQQHRVRIFGEMVALLWARGNRVGAIRLERLWNELSKTRPFSLFCAYPMSSFDGKENEAEFTEICRQHSQVFSADSYAHLSEDERLRALALLRQKANSLEIEVAERKKAEERLRMLAAIVESSHDAILSKDLKGTITSWNTAAEGIYGYTPEEIVGQSVTRIFPPGHQDEFRQIMERIKRGERIEHHETKRMRKDGTLLTMSVTISPVKDEAGVIVGASTIAHNITEQKQVEARSQRLFASNLIGIFVADGTGAVLEANDAFLDLVGYTRAEWLAATTQPETLAASLAPFLNPALLRTVLATGESGPQETVVQRKGGQQLPVLVAMTSMEHSDTCIGFVLDISERKALEQRKDEFISMASHELKTPVTSLKGFLNLLQRLLTPQGDAKALHYLARMNAQIDKLAILINDLLDISKMQTGQLVYREECFEIDGLVHEIIENVQETTQTHQLQLAGQTQAMMLGDRDRLGQVLINLLTNAIKYSPQADTVNVRLTTQENQVIISVQDFGLGIAKEHQSKIFERFYQVTDPEEKTYPGLGIGLYISSDIVKRQGGQIWVESQKGAGATFYVSLPLYQESKRSTMVEQGPTKMEHQNAE